MASTAEIEDAKAKALQARYDAIDAQSRASEALRYAIQAEIAALVADLRLAEVRRDPDWHIKRLYRQMEVLGSNLNSTSQFIRAAFETGWWRGTRLGF